MMWCWVAISAQRHIVFSDNIASLQVVAGTRWQDMPIIRLNGNEPIVISFDDLSHTYRRLTYSVKHMEADWTPSEGLFPSDYLAGFHDGLTIEDSEESINTTQNYTHYTLRLPNRECSFLMSGNYRVDIFDDNDDDKPMLSAFFMVSEERANVGISYTVDTDIDVRKNHQQAIVNIDYSNLHATDPQRQIKGCVLQNGCWSDVRWLPEPNYITQKMQEWNHCRDLIFEAGNEYRKFEILDVNRNSLNVENNAWDDKEETWHTILWPDYKRQSYVYDESARGAFYIRNSDNSENNTTSEYVKVHFILQSEKLPYDVYVNGKWTNDRFLPQYKMAYDNAKKVYEAIVPLKYGYYSYRYLMLPENGVVEDSAAKDDDLEEGRIVDENAGNNLAQPLIPPTEGSFYQTKNKYNVLVYFRGNTDRADRLVGAK